ncbi:MAG: hypothetical protein IC227_06400 [Enterococcus lacertideformus]|uniref:Uncharacterized protein n=1 Tax=Enterococcus lacertideformus TaxID=2771493 RepID=A0A931AVT7_9ENTE|nr:hypothetical protein [Enterococcus lacertideformus]
MGALMIVAVYQALLKYPEYGTKLLSITKDPTAYSPTLLLSTLTAGAKSATYFLHQTSSILKRKKQRKQLIIVIVAMGIIYFLPVFTQLYHQYFN